MKLTLKIGTRTITVTVESGRNSSQLAAQIIKGYFTTVVVPTEQAELAQEIMSVLKCATKFLPIPNADAELTLNAKWESRLNKEGVSAVKGTVHESKLIIFMYPDLNSTVPTKETMQAAFGNKNNKQIPNMSEYSSIWLKINDSLFEVSHLTGEAGRITAGGTQSKPYQVQIGQGVYVLKLPKESAKGDYQKELKVLKELNSGDCTGIIKMPAIDCPLILMEKAEQNLHEKKWKIEESECRQSFRDIATGLNLIHKLNYSHDDLQVSNIVCFPQSKLKLIDIGFTTISPQSRKDNITVLAEIIVSCVVGEASSSLQDFVKSAKNGNFQDMDAALKHPFWKSEGSG